MWRILLHIGVVSTLTILTQLGGLAWLAACLFKKRLLAFVVAYTALSLAAVWAAPQFGRVALICFERGPLQVQSWIYCALNRNYVTPAMADVLADTAGFMDQAYPGTVTLVLDANFPFLDGFPLLPHLSHDDGEKADLAFYYRDESGYLPGVTRSFLGYFAFEPGPTDCLKVWPTLRWNFDAIQPLWPSYDFDIQRNRLVIETLASDERVGKIFVEPHLVELMEISDEKARFQGCRAARHDDHIHFQLNG